MNWEPFGAAASFQLDPLRYTTVIPELRSRRQGRYL